MDKDIQHIHQLGQQIVFHVTADKQHYIHTFINCQMIYLKQLQYFMFILLVVLVIFY